MKEKFGTHPNGREVNIYTISNPNNIRVKIIDYGAIVVSIEVPDRNGKFADVVLGCDSLEKYLTNEYYLGAIIGRCANRINEGRFELNSEHFQLAVNNGGNHLHGGLIGFDKVIWNSEIIEKDGNAGVMLSYNSADGEESYPGNLKVKVIYMVTVDNQLRIEYEATTDKPTPVNLTHHSYFNLAGEGAETVLDHTLQINARSFTPTDENAIPIGVVRAVEGTPFDFLQPKRIGDHIEIDEDQLKYGAGYDHNFVLNKNTDELLYAAKLTDPASGRTMKMYTTEPGIQLYTSNWLDGTLVGKSGLLYGRRSAVCLEAQHFPDSVNHMDFPSIILDPGRTYTQTTIYEFGVAE